MSIIARFSVSDMPYWWSQRLCIRPEAVPEDIDRVCDEFVDNVRRALLKAAYGELSTMDGVRKEPTVAEIEWPIDEPLPCALSPAMVRQHKPEASDG